MYEKLFTDGVEVENNHWLESKLTTRNIPKRAISLIYNNETVEFYEQPR